jgi:hypothetical protein
MGGLQKLITDLDMRNGFDNRFGYEKWLQGGCMVLALLKKGGGITLSFTLPGKEFFYIYL